MTDNSQIRILAVDDDDDGLFALTEVLESEGFQVLKAQAGNEVLRIIESELPDLVLLDIVMPEPNGYEVTKYVKAHPVLKYIPIVLLTSKDDLEDVVKGFECGADDYVIKPFKRKELLARVQAVLRTRNLYRELKDAHSLNTKLQGQIENRFQFENIIGQSSTMEVVYDLMTKVKEADVPVLVTGESGTGKELVAHALHYNSPRKDRPFVVQNCSAFNENLLESELFGHVKGSFTGAVRDKEGLFEAADTGSFFLDELGEMSVALQVKLLRVLQDGTFTPVGSTQTKKVNVRVIAATNRDLKAMVKEGTFREDLYYRLNVVNIELPPLRERRSDIPLLVQHFVRSIAKRTDKKEKLVSPASLQKLTAYDWPGNIRELQNESERFVIMSGEEEEVQPAHLSPHISGMEAGQQEAPSFEGTLKEAVEDLERRMILATLEQVEGNKSEAARVLGISRSNLINKVQAYGIA